MKFHILILLVLLAFGCSETNKNGNSNINANAAKSTPSPEPTIADKEKGKSSEKEDDERLKAINNFLEKNYKGWQLKGFAENEYGNCQFYLENVPCDLHLMKGNQDKVITVVIKRFAPPDGESYWFVYEARSIDLAQAKIQEIKNKGKQIALENLEYEHCESICDDHKY